jgi:hypothetical protein
MEGKAYDKVMGADLRPGIYISIIILFAIF